MSQAILYCVFILLTVEKFSLNPMQLMMFLKILISILHHGSKGFIF